MAHREDNAGARSSEAPPEAWGLGFQLMRRARAPIERFLAIEAASGLILLLAAMLALAWANSPFREVYSALWHLPLGVRMGAFEFERDLHFWINDGLMTVFFFVVGLEIRREIHAGELSELRRAALPLAAALGGMLAPAAGFWLLNAGRTSAGGWGVPMATDIAFAVGCLALLGKRVPPALRVLLLALAVIDDVGAILVIAFFYSSGIQPVGLALIAAGMGAVIALQKFGMRNPLSYVAPGVVVWAGAFVLGVHPTLAGVILGLMTPAQAWLGPARVADQAEGSAADLRTVGDDRAALSVLQHLERAQREAVSPAERIEHALHGLVAFGIMPLFAFANAGVPLGEASMQGDAKAVFWGVLLGLLLGKPLGIVAFSWLATRLGLARLPRGIALSQVTLVGVVGGIGFTMALFIAQLAFPAGELLETAKLAILVASGLAALSATLLGALMLPKLHSGVDSEAEAECSTEA